MWDSKRVQIMGASNHTEQESWESLNSWKKEKKKKKVVSWAFLDSKNSRESIY